MLWDFLGGFGSCWLFFLSGGEFSWVCVFSVDVRTSEGPTQGLKAGQRGFDQSQFNCQGAGKEKIYVFIDVY